MITEKYIIDFKKTRTFEIIASGLMRKQYLDVILGRRGYRTTIPIENSPEDTVPSQVIIAAHVLILEGKISAQDFASAIETLEIDQGNICLLLDYMHCFLVYKKAHSELRFDASLLYSKITSYAGNNVVPPCYESLIKNLSIG